MQGGQREYLKLMCVRLNGRLQVTFTSTSNTFHSHAALGCLTDEIGRGVNILKIET